MTLGNQQTQKLIGKENRNRKTHKPVRSFIRANEKQDVNHLGEVEKVCFFWNTTTLYHEMM